MAPKKRDPPSLEALSRLARELHRQKAEESVPKVAEAAAPPSIAAEPCEAPAKRRRLKKLSDDVAPPSNAENKSGNATAELAETKVDKTPAEIPGSKVDKSYKEIPRSKVDKTPAGIPGSKVDKSYKEIPRSKVDKSYKEIPRSKVDKSYKEIPRPKANQKKTNRTKLMEDKSVKLARGKSKILTAKDMDKAEEFDPSHLPFQVTWKNFKKLQDHYKLSEAETTSVLLAMVGPSPGAEKYWSKYRVPKKYASGNEISEESESEDHMDTMPEPGTAPATPAKPADDVDGTPMSDENMAPSEEDADDDDLLSSTGSSDGPGPPPPPRPAVPGECQLELEEPEHHERVKQPVDEEVVLAKHALEQSLQAAATPAKAGESRTPSGGNLKSLQSCETLVLGQKEVSRQASVVSKEPAASPGADSELGPSASAAALDVSADKCDQLLACLTTMQQLVQDPSIREAMHGLASQFPGLLSPGPTEKDAAQEGKPASSKPAGGSVVKPAALAVPDPKEEPSRENKPDVKEKPKADAAAEAKVEADVKDEDTADEMPQDEVPGNPPPEASICNSSTHRREHARLSRRMAHIDPAKFPEMTRLWNGNRTEKAELLRQFISSSESLEATESTLTVSKKQSAEVETGKELLTIRQMVEKGFSQTKIDNILKRGDAVPDPDAPSDPESTRFWCTVGGKYFDREQTTVEGSASVALRPTAGGVCPLLDSADMPAPCLSGPSAPASTVSLAALVQVAADNTGADRNGGGGGGGAGAGAKAKAKAKAKALPQNPLTAKDKKEAGRKEIKKEMGNMNILFELPKENTLRRQLQDLKGEMESMFDKLSRCSEEELDEIYDEAKELVDASRMCRAQARAVVSEMKKADQAASKGK